MFVEDDLSGMSYTIAGEGGCQVDMQTPEKNYRELYVALQQEVIRLRREAAELEVALGKERLDKRTQVPETCPECGRFLMLECAVHGHFEWPE